MKLQYAPYKFGKNQREARKLNAPAPSQPYPPQPPKLPPPPNLLP